MPDLREIERQSIRAFVQNAADEGYLSGRVLDYGCGKQPYRDIVEAAGGEYHGFDRFDFPANVSGEDIGDNSYGEDNLLCTQVLQYVPDPDHELSWFRHILKQSQGHLVLTYPTNWPEVEPEDLHRFTKAGMERLLTDAGFEIIRHERRGEVRMLNEVVALGYGVICRA